MARLPRLCLAGIPRHVMQRGNNRQICFGSEEDFSAYAHWLEESSRKYKVSIHAWVFMTNHRELFLAHFDQSLLNEIRTAVNKGMAFDREESYIT